MIFTKRERIMGIIVGGAALVAGLYYFAVDPWILVPHAAVVQQLDAKMKINSDNLATINKAKSLAQVWQSLETNGLTSNSAAADTELAAQLTAFSNYRPFPVTFSSQRSDPRNLPLDSEKFYERSMTYEAEGSALGVEQLVYNIETVQLPIRMTGLKITAKREGVDDLQLTVNVATIYPNGEVISKTVQPPATAKETK